MKFNLFAFSILFFTLPAFGEVRVDPYTGNTYIRSGNTTFGSNPGTGSTWTTTTTPNGNSFGTDSRGNNWNYNSNSGVYQNYGTGQIRINGR